MTVTTDFQKNPDEILLVYKIDRGVKHKVARILFHGNYAISEKELLAQVTVKKSHIWTHGSLSQKLLKQSASNIEALYRDRGYEEIKVKPRTIDREQKIDVDFEIEEGSADAGRGRSGLRKSERSLCATHRARRDSNCDLECRSRRESWPTTATEFPQPT